MAPSRLLLLAVGVELLEERDQIIGLLLVLQPGVDHLGAGDFRLWILDVLSEGRLVPGDAGILVGGRICVAGYAARLRPITPFRTGPTPFFAFSPIW